MTDDPIAIFPTEDVAPAIDDLLAPFISARADILGRHPLKKSLADILKADPAPQLRDLKDILSSVSGDSLQLDQVFDMEKMKAAWETEKAANQAARNAAFAALRSDAEGVATRHMRPKK